MSRDEIRAQIQQNLEDAEVEASDLRVQRDPYGGWNIAVISDDFEGMPTEKREKTVLDSLSIEIEWIDLLTPQEREWAGTLPADIEVDDLPLWPEAMARSLDQKEELTFLSDLETDISLPITATFYSHRGGVGRSTALGYAAQILADRGHTVLCVDMDLEAPGLAALFGQGEEVQEKQGLVPLLFHLDQGGEPDIMDHLLRISETDELYCLPAGRPSANYARMLRFIDPTAYYQEEKNPLLDLVNRLENDLSFKPDVLLFDARTGLNALNGPLLFDLSDLAIIVFFPHPQARDGTESLINGLLSSYTNRANGDRLTPEPRFLISPVPSSNVGEVAEQYQLRSEDWIQEWVEPIDVKRNNGESFSDNLEDLTHFVTYQEAIATSDAIRPDEDIWRNYTAVADWIEGFLPSEKEKRLEEQTERELQRAAREEFEFPTGVAENQPRLLETYVLTRGITKALKPDIPLVRGRKGTGKTALFRRLYEDDDTSTVSILAPTIEGAPDWQPSPEAFERIEDAIRETETSWRVFWAAYVGLACHLQEPSFEESTARTEEIDSCLPEDVRSPLDTVETIRELLDLEDAGLRLTAWLNQLDRDANPETLLLFDRLDTGFGNEEEHRERRKRAIEGLFSLFLDQETRLEHLRFKILLREDIWGNVEFDNKSHLFGRSVQLEWSSKIDFIEVIVRHALRSDSFRQLAEQTESVRRGLLDDVDAPAEVDLSEEETYDLWYLLVGERMRGAKTTYTYNWVWTRLADGTDNHSPRPLLQLFREANEWEKKEDSVYGKSIIRPRALIESLDTVSNRALSALVEEEFQELQPLVDRLAEIGRTPVDAEDLHEGLEENLNDEINLALEVGLLKIYEGTEEDVRRYKVPDLYRYGVGMTRKGRA